MCTLESSPETMRIVDDQMLGKLFVGTTNFLYIFSLDLLVSETVDLSSSSETVEDCQGFGPGQLARNPPECENFIVNIATIPEDSEDSDDNKLVVCGTNAFFVRCTLHKNYNPANFTKLSPPNVIDAGFSPHTNTRNFVSILASNSRFFSATIFGALGVRTVLRMSPGLLQEPKVTTFTVGTPSTDPRWLNDPVFVSAHEYGEHVYFFVTEIPFELTTPVFRYSRVIRLCKTDDGIGQGTNPAQNHFLTFVKATLECSVSAVGGALPFIYNDLQSTYLLVNGDSLPALYGVFSSPINGPPGGAICKFSFDPTASGSVTRVFEDTDYLVRQLDTSWSKDTSAAFSCPGSPGLGTQRPTEATENFHLKYDPITSTPLFVSEEGILDKIAVEVVSYSGEAHEVIYYTNRQGDIKQIIASDDEIFEHTVYTSASASPISDLLVQSGAAETTLLASTSDGVLVLLRGRCSEYTFCFNCFDMGDAYCGWNGSVCKNVISTTNSSLIRSFSANETVITSACGPRPTITTPRPRTPCDEDPTTVPTEATTTTTPDITTTTETTTTPPPQAVDTTRLAMETSRQGINTASQREVTTQKFGNTDDTMVDQGGFIFADYSIPIIGWPLGAIIVAIVSGVIFVQIRILKRTPRRHRPSLPPPGSMKSTKPLQKLKKPQQDGLKAPQGRLSMPEKSNMLHAPTSSSLTTGSGSADGRGLLKKKRTLTKPLMNFFKPGLAKQKKKETRERKQRTKAKDDALTFASSDSSDIETVFRDAIAKDPELEFEFDDTRDIM